MTVRYTLQLLANTIFSREKVTTTIKTKLMMLHQAIKRTMRINPSDMIEEENPPTNPASIFLKELINIKHERDQSTNPKIYIGGMLTLLFQDIGVDLED